MFFLQGEVNENTTIPCQNGIPTHHKKCSLVFCTSKPLTQRIHETFCFAHIEISENPPASWSPCLLSSPHSPHGRYCLHETSVPTIWSTVESWFNRSSKTVEAQIRRSLPSPLFWVRIISSQKDGDWTSPSNLTSSWAPKLVRDLKPNRLPSACAVIWVVDVQQNLHKAMMV